MTKIKKMIMANNEDTCLYLISFYDEAKKLAHEKGVIRFKESYGKKPQEIGGSEIADELATLFAHKFSSEDFERNGAHKMYKNIWELNMPSEYAFEEAGFKIALCQQVLVGLLCKGDKNKAISFWKVLRLQSICENYMTHLRRDIDKSFGRVLSHDEIINKDLSSLVTPKLKYTVKTYQSVGHLLSILKGKDSDVKKIKKFKDGFQKIKPEIEVKKSESRSTTAFLKQVMRVIGASIEKLSFFHPKDKQSEGKSGAQIAAKK